MKVKKVKAIKEIKNDQIIFILQTEDGSILFPSGLNVKVKNLIKQQDFKGGYLDNLFLPKGCLGMSKILVVSLGKLSELELSKFKKGVGFAVKTLQKSKSDRLAIIFPKEIFKNLKTDNVVRETIIATELASYQFFKYISKKENRAEPIKEINILVFNDIPKFNQVVKEAQIVSGAVNFFRDLGNLPPIEMTPTYLANQALNLAKNNSHLKVKVLGELDIIKEKMGALHGVSLGSSEEPKFIVMEYFNAPKSHKTYVLAGKAITFDTGGISLKPGQGMEEMKFDMLGGGAVMGAMKAISELNLKINIVGLIPATENKPGEKAYRPGDILRAKNGKTIEVINTDAEGRLILADALSYAQKYKPNLVVDLATLTGACVVALGENFAAGLFTPEDDLVQQFEQASLISGEKIWRLPIDDLHREEMKSKIADIKNLGNSRYGGASQAAAFLEEFTDYPWVHLDIAPVMAVSDSPHLHPGASGYGVQLLVALAKSWVE